MEIESFSRQVYVNCYIQRAAYSGEREVTLLMRPLLCSEEWFQQNPEKESFVEGINQRLFHFTVPVSNLRRSGGKDAPPLDEMFPRKNAIADGKLVVEARFAKLMEEGPLGPYRMTTSFGSEGIDVPVAVLDHQYEEWKRSDIEVVIHATLGLYYTQGLRCRVGTTLPVRADVTLGVAT